MEARPAIQKLDLPHGLVCASQLEKRDRPTENPPNRSTTGSALSSTTRRVFVASCCRKGFRPPPPEPARAAQARPARASLAVSKEHRLPPCSEGGAPRRATRGQHATGFFGAQCACRACKPTWPSHPPGPRTLYTVSVAPEGLELRSRSLWSVPRCLLVAPVSTGGRLGLCPPPPVRSPLMEKPLSDGVTDHSGNL